MIIKTPGINGFGKTNGCRDTGRAVIKELKDVNTNEEGREINKHLDLEEIHVNNDNLEEQSDLIYENSKKAFENNERVIFLGGDHSISYDIGKAFLDSEWENKEKCLIVFDAHADCMDPNKEPTHEEWLRGLIEKGFNPENVLLVCNRNLYKDEEDFLVKKKVKRVRIDDIENNLENVGDIITEFAFGKNTYLSIDIDAIDPAFAPATNYPVAGGISSRQFLYLAKRLNKIQELKAVDLVEIDLGIDKNYNFRTVKLAAKILAEFL